MNQDSYNDSSNDFSELKPLDINNFKINKKIYSDNIIANYLIEEKLSGHQYRAVVFRNEYAYKMKKIFYKIKILEHISKLNSPFLIKYIGYSLKSFKGKSLPTIISEFPQNGTLDSLLNSVSKGTIYEEWNDTKKLMVIYGIAYGMHVLHSNKILHRGLTPMYISLDEYLLPIIDDFSISIKEDDLLLEEKNEINGAPVYASPEVLTEQKHSKSSDVYSFAIIVYEIITGKKPFGIFNTFKIASKVIKGERPEIDQFVPESYKNLIIKCWNQKPEERPTFEEIINLLKTDKGFITDSIDEAEFLEFIETIEEKVKNSAQTTSEDKPIFKFKKVHIEYHEIKELLVDIDPIDLSLFKPLKFIGQGQFGKVYKIKDKNTGELLASKINIKELKFLKTIEITNLTREINNLSNLNSPTVLRFIGYNQKDFKGKPKPVIITEFSQNGSLDDIIELRRRGQSPEKWTSTKQLITIYGIALGMSYIHSKNILHRDLKPANVFYDEYLFPKIGDFGLSKDINSTSSENISKYQIGTPVFMSPEIFDKSKYCKASDVYAFGILLYELITLELPYKNLTFYKIGELITSGERPIFNIDIQDCYRKLIEQCWCQNEDDRPTFDDIVNLLENDESFITEEVDENEFHEYIEYIKNNKITKSFETVTVDFEELKRIQENDPMLNISFLDLNHFDKKEIIKRLDNYKIHKIINKETGQQYEAKISIMKITELKQQEIIHLQREINILCKLDHPSFLKFIGYSPIDFNQEPKPVIVTEMPPNRSLKDLLNIERNDDHIEEWTDTKKLIYIYGIASGMSYLHNYNVIHRNINPESIFLDDYLFPKIGNFGLLAKIHSNATMTYQTMLSIKGNPAYSSPELLEYNEYSKESDVYAFSLIVYEIMTLNIPFEKIRNFKKLYDEVVKKFERPKFDEEIPKCYRQLIEMCWSQNPSDRPTFDEIASLLKNDKEFITDKINQDEFYEYINFIEKSKIEFYSNNRVVKFDDLIQCDNKNNKDEDKNQDQKAKTNSEVEKADKQKQELKCQNINVEKNEHSKTIENKDDNETNKNEKIIENSDIASETLNPNKIKEEESTENQNAISNKISETTPNETNNTSNNAIKIIEQVEDLSETKSNETYKYESKINENEDDVNKKSAISNENIISKSDQTNIETNEKESFDDKSIKKEEFFNTSLQNNEIESISVFIEEKEELINEFDQQKQEHNDNSNTTKIENQPKEIINSINKEDDYKFIHKCVSNNQPHELIEYLLNNYDNEGISIIFDQIYTESRSFYDSLCEEGILHNIAVAQYKYALNLIHKGQEENNDQNKRDLYFKESCTYLLESIRQGYIKSYFPLSLLHYLIFKDEHSSVEYALEGMNQGEPNSECLYGYFQSRGIGMNKDHSKGIKHILDNQSIDFSKLFSTDIALFYVEQHEINKNNQNEKYIKEEYSVKAFEWFYKAYETNKTKAAINNYGLCFLKGFGVSKDIEKAIEIFEDGAKRGDSNSKYYLSFIRSNYIKDTENSKESSIDSTQNKNLNMINEISSESNNEQNKEKIVELAQKYSQENDSENIYIFMNKCIKENHSEVVLEYAINLYKNHEFKVSKKYFELLININHPIAKYFIGVMKYFGQGYAKNQHESEEIMRFLSERGIDLATEFIENYFS